MSIDLLEESPTSSAEAKAPRAALAGLSIWGLSGRHLTRHPRGAEDQDERQPSAEETVERIEAPIVPPGALFLFLVRYPLVV